MKGDCVKFVCRLGLFFCLADASVTAQMTKHIGYSTFAGLEPMVAVSLERPVQTYQQAEIQNYMASARFADAPAGTPGVPSAGAIPAIAPSPIIRNETPPPPKFKWKPALSQ